MAFFLLRELVLPKAFVIVVNLDVYFMAAVAAVASVASVAAVAAVAVVACVAAAYIWLYRYVLDNFGMST